MTNSPIITITGGGGVLGRALTTRLINAGYTVRITSRRASSKSADSVQRVQAHLDTGAGLLEAVRGSEVVIHAASSPFKDTHQVDVKGTDKLLKAAQAAGVRRVFYISIVGIENFPSFKYYKAKLAAEQVVRASGLDWSILRATQFHELVDTALTALFRFPMVFWPADFQVQPIAASEAADRMVEAITGGESGALPDIAGPEVLQVKAIARQWLEATGKKRLLIHAPYPSQTFAAFRAGKNTAPDHAYGRITWGQWLANRYPSPMLKQVEAVSG